MLADSDLLPLGRDLAAWLRGQRFGEVRVHDVTSEIVVDADGDPAVTLVAIVADPRADTWPLEDVMSLRGAVREQANERELSLNVYVTLRPTTEDQQDDEASEA